MATGDEPDITRRVHADCALPFGAGGRRCRRRRLVHESARRWDGLPERLLGFQYLWWRVRVGEGNTTGGAAACALHFSWVRAHKHSRPLSTRTYHVEGLRSV
eukprot:3801484-Prymnesium_polylepis.2